MGQRKITVNNPSIWRPILDIRDAATAYLRAIQADYSLSGVFNVASGNYTVGQVGDMVKYEVEKLTGEKVEIALKNIEDFRNYKVTIDKARTYLGYQPQHAIEDIIDDLYANRANFEGYEDERFYNIKVFKKITT
jgi:nucleoside-diphosphate-sugar epimerase